MKKILAFVLIALLAVTSVFATGTTETTATAPAAGAAEGGKIYDGVEITMWSMWNAAEPQGQAIIDAAAQFEEETGSLKKKQAAMSTLSSADAISRQSSTHLSRAVKTSTSLKKPTTESISSMLHTAMT